MKDFLRAVFILAVFALIGVATKYNIPYPCDTQIRRYFESDFTVAFYQGYSNDTIIIRADKDTLWDIKSPEICRILRDSCKMKNANKILIVDSTWDQSKYDTRFGKKMHFYNCP
jgi:hypothetical protein